MKFSTTWLAVIILVTVTMDTASSKSLPQSDYIDLSSYGTRMFGVPSREVGVEVANWNPDQNRGNPEELGTYLEGDILFPSPKSRNGLIDETTRWPNATVPFEIVGDFGKFLNNPINIKPIKPGTRLDARQMDTLEKAINAYHENTCLKFTPRTSSDTDYISIQGTDSGCWSSVGRVGGRQVVNLQKNGCMSTVGTPIHELMHVVGFKHEQTREDRDDFVEIVRDNIKPGYENNFEKADPGTTSGFGTSYDYGSVMHYSDLAFSKNGEPTIVNKKKLNGKMGQRHGFAKSDIKRINNMYNCKMTTASSGYKLIVKLTQSVSGGINDILNEFMGVFKDETTTTM
ncbi:zinc metalloproteinase nas-4-like isoform X2 [Bradysia coprophila]|uniref:zinc metalloproteinase nas-4-like isoform X2 n=1 Tax=Bradysia coprophila TaxID=38358 RepID=UPI00187D94FE|nr:zinc metalloproteinase nas-4-like isoform X2 [Bradysia coprophila]